MMLISLCMIVKNEEAVLARCLDTVKDLVDEIIIADTGSTDGTKKIALEYTDKVYDFEWVDDFSAARNFSFEKANATYCMWLDADDIFTEDDRVSFKNLKETLDDTVDVVMMKYNTEFDQHGNPTFYYYRERIIRKQDTFRWEGAVHEVIAPFGKIVYDGTAVTHKKMHPNPPGRNLNIYQNLLRSGKTLSPREEFYYARELYYNGMYREAACIFNAFLDGKKGWVINNIDACIMLARCCYVLGEGEKGFDSLVRSLRYGTPNPEACCNIAAHFFSREMYKEAVFWYNTAASAEPDDKSGGFFKTDYQGYIPYIQLAVCHSKLGDTELAISCNEKAGSFKPGDAKVEHNRKYFDNLKKTSENKT